jgi:hypothetical protein
MNLPRQGWGIDNCFECVLGIWDDPVLSTNLGEIVAGQPKDIYIGIKFADGFGGTSGISFSVAGLREFLVTRAEPIVPTVINICDVLSAPADTSDTSRIGGCTFFWPGCLVGNQALLRVSILTFSEVTNAVLQVKRQYPTPHPDIRTPFIYQCDRPVYTSTRVTGGFFILNWNGDPSVGLEGATWTTVKHLYRDATR